MGKKGFTLVELVIVLSLSVLVIGMVLTLTLAISDQAAEGRRAEGIASELAVLRRVFGQRRDALVSGEELAEFDAEQKTLTFSSAAEEKSVSFFYLTGLRLAVRGENLRIVLAFGEQEYALFFAGRELT